MQRLIQTLAARCGLISLFLALSVRLASAQYLVTIIQPTNGAVYTVPADIVLLATVQDLSGSPVSTTITNVSFYANGVFLGTANQLVLDPPGVNGVTGLVYELGWTNASPGAYALTAVATDDRGISSTSAPVNITVPGIGPGPVVRITSPPNHAVFFQPVNIPIFAFAAAIYPGAANNLYTSISNVEFYAGNIDIGPGHRVAQSPPGPLLPPVVLLPFDFTIVWSNAPAGVYALTAVATDDRGMMATSAPVSITVVPTKIITNGIDVVSIVATDPVAIAGTNCWIWPGLANATPTWAAWKQPTWCLHTNCGPKDATFMVRRAGEITNDLTVFYGISGTASNGVDYAMLPGTVMIPAGQSYAFINVVPLTSPPAAAVETVILTLQQPIDIPTDYIIGKPSCAVAIIIDRPVPYPPTTVLPGSLFHITASGPDGAWFCVESSSDLINWQPIATNQVVNGCIDFVDPNGTAGTGYYQAVPQTAAPLQ